MLKHKIIQLLTIIHVILQILDGSLTYYGVYLYGIGVEGNRLIVKLMELLGVEFGLIIPKTLGILFVYYIYCLYKNFNHLSKIIFVRFFLILIIINMIYTLVVSQWVYFLFIY